MTPETKLTLIIFGQICWFLIDKAIMWGMFVINRRKNKKFMIAKKGDDIIVRVGN